MVRRQRNDEAGGNEDDGNARIRNDRNDEIRSDDDQSIGDNNLVGRRRESLLLQPARHHQQQRRNFIDLTDYDDDSSLASTALEESSSSSLVTEDVSPLSSSSFTTTLAEKEKVGGNDNPSSDIQRGFGIVKTPNEHSPCGVFKKGKDGNPTIAAMQNDAIDPGERDPLHVLGVDITTWDRRMQFVVLAVGFFCSSLFYGYLQELIQVELSSRHLGLFLAMLQFSGYTVLAYAFNNLISIVDVANDNGFNSNYKFSDNRDIEDGIGGGRRAHAVESVEDPAKIQGADKSQQRQQKKKKKNLEPSPATLPAYVSMAPPRADNSISNQYKRSNALLRKSSSSASLSSSASTVVTTALEVPAMLFLGLSFLRAIDLAMTNLAMQYINYPAKTLMKSSRVVFVMLFSIVINGKRYAMQDYTIVLAMVAGLVLFMHADSTSADAVFHPYGVMMLIISLICDAAVSNMSEIIMNRYRIGQDEFILRLYSIALVAVGAAAAMRDDITQGILWLMEPGTYQQMLDDAPYDERVYSATVKIACVVMFSSMGFVASSTSTAMVKHFGALSMSMTSTARKATTLFLSIMVFNNACTKEHMIGMIIFIFALLTKSFRTREKKQQLTLPETLTAKLTSTAATENMSTTLLREDAEASGTARSSNGSNSKFDDEDRLRDQMSNDAQEHQQRRFQQQQRSSSYRGSRPREDNPAPRLRRLDSVLSVGEFRCLDESYGSDIDSSGGSKTNPIQWLFGGNCASRYSSGGLRSPHSTAGDTTTGTASTRGSYYYNLLTTSGSQQ